MTKIYGAVFAVVFSICGLSAYGEEPEPLPGKFKIAFRKGLEKEHPRLLFGKKDVQRWRKQGRIGKEFIWDAGQRYASSLGRSVPGNEAWNTGDWQRITWWQGATTIMLYATTGDKRYSDWVVKLMVAMCRSEDWEKGGERNYGMAAANIMAFVALAYDTTYDLLTQEQRDLVRRRLYLAADRFYHYGWNDLKQYPGRAARYWQNDPQNNHRWHRLCGYLWGCLAIYGEEPGIDGYLNHAIKEAEFVLKWLPEDGSNHESVSYQAFGTQYLVPTIASLDRCLGTNHLGTNRGFRELPHFRAHMVVPNRQGVWSYGDGGEGTYYFSHYNFKCAALWGDGIMQAAHVKNFQASPGSYAYHGLTLWAYDPALKQGNLSKYPTHRFFPDMGIATFRENWEDPDALAVFFKCSVYGGHLLNEYRYSFSQPHYVNVAHDHPDANEFLINWKGEYFAQDLGTNKRRTWEHSTIMVNGKDQEGAGKGWTQPIKDMNTRADVEQYFGAEGYGIMRADAGGYYEDLDRFARTFIYVDDAYVLIADDIRAKSPSTIDWYYKCKGNWSEKGEGKWEIRKGKAAVRVYFAEPEGLKVEKEVDGIKVEKERAVRTRFLCLVSPQSAKPAEIAWKRRTKSGFLLKIERGNLTDWIAIGSQRSDELTTDGEAAVLTVKGKKPVKAMVIGGTKLTGKEFKFSFTAKKKVNALVDGDADSLTICAPLKAKGRKVNVTVKGISLKKVNGEKWKGISSGKITCPVPTWQEYQDEADGFNAIMEARKRK